MRFLALVALGMMTACAGAQSAPQERADATAAADGSAETSCAEVLQTPQGPMGPTNNATALNYAVRTVYLGETDRSGTSDTSAWTQFGLDLDGKDTTVLSNDVCTLAPGAAKAVQVDGTCGIDNSFGKNVVPMLSSLFGVEISRTVSTQMGGGSFTLMAVVVGFDDSVGGTTSASGLSGVLLGGGNYEATYGAAPAWDASVAWPTSSFGLTCGAACDGGTDPIKAAISVLNAPYQLDGQFVSGTPNAMSLMLSVEWPLTINVRAATITFRSVGARSVSGTFAGVIAPSELIDDVTAIAAGTGSLCKASALAAVTQQIAVSADIVATSAGLENVHGVACNAISFGVGFDADEIAMPAVGDVVTYDASTPVGCGD